MLDNNHGPRESAVVDGSRRKVLTFCLGNETYGVDILRVKEIRGWSPVTRIPQSAECMLGVLNLRGVVVPIMDLRLRFALPAAEFNSLTVVIVLSLSSGAAQREIGIVVDSVQDVVDLDAPNIKPSPTISGGAAELIEGIATHGAQMLILLATDSLAPFPPSLPSAAEHAA